MMIYDILDDNGSKINTIIADQDFVDAAYPGKYVLVGEAPSEKPVVPDIHELIKAERDRRLELDFTFQGVQFQRDESAVRRINGAGTLALAAIVGGAKAGNLRWHGGASDFVWIASDNSLVPMDAQTVMAFGGAAAGRETALLFAAKAIRAMDPIPSDYTDDKYWP